MTRIASWIEWLLDLVLGGDDGSDTEHAVGTAGVPVKVRAAHPQGGCPVIGTLLQRI